MEFSPNNKIVKLCLQGIGMEEKNNTEEALKIFLQAWKESANDFEKFMAAFFVARQQQKVSDKLQWLETALQLALKINDDAVQSAFPILYSDIGKCYEELGDASEAKNNEEKSASFNNTPSDKGPFYHGTKADLQLGDLLTAGGDSNYKDGLTMNHIYFTALANGAGLAAHLAKGNGSERVYIVEPTGSFENDPNVTNKKFPGNLTRSYRSEAPLKIIGEATDWTRQTPEQLQHFRERLAKSKENIIN